MTAIAAAPVTGISGSRIGRYRLLERIGGGAMGNVYAAEDDALGRQVAIKVIAADMEDEPETRERFYREARTTARIVHRNIVTLLDIGEDQGRLYIAMELLHGLPLGEFLRGRVAGAPDTNLDLMIQLCEGLQAAHECGTVHRDVKPGNLFVQHDGVLTILDFGLAHVQASTLTAAGMVLGTPSFMSPEQAEGRSVDPRSDIFSASAVGYLLMTGRAPFAAADLPGRLHALLHDDPAPIPETDASAALARVLFKGLAKDPEQRYQRCADMLTDLRQVGSVLGDGSRRWRSGTAGVAVGHGEGFWSRLTAFAGMVHL